MIHAPRLLPDEWAPGYWGRLLHLNGLSLAKNTFVIKQLVSRLCRDGDPKFKGVQRLLVAISSAAHVSVEDVLRSHTLLPFHGALSGVADFDWFGDDRAAISLRTAASVEGRTGGALCPRCVQEDLDFWGFGYWRRSHQIDELDWCTKHECALRHLRGEFGCLPLAHHVRSRDLIFRRAGKDEGSATQRDLQQRLAEICCELLHRKRPLFRLKVLHALILRTQSFGMRVEKTDYSWQLKQDGRGLPKGEHPLLNRETLNGVLWRYYFAPATIDYVLVIALLYPSVDAAFAGLENPLPSLESLMPAITRQARQHSKNWHAPDAIQRRIAQLRLIFDLVISGAGPAEIRERTGFYGVSFESNLFGCLLEHPRPRRVARSPRLAVKAC